MNRQAELEAQRRSERQMKLQSPQKPIPSTNQSGNMHHNNNNIFNSHENSHHNHTVHVELQSHNPVQNHHHVSVGTVLPRMPSDYSANSKQSNGSSSSHNNNNSVVSEGANNIATMNMKPSNRVRFNFDEHGRVQQINVHTTPAATAVDANNDSNDNAGNSKTDNESLHHSAAANNVDKKMSPRHQRIVIEQTDGFSSSDSDIQLFTHYNAHQKFLAMNNHKPTVQGVSEKVDILTPEKPAREHVTERYVRALSSRNISK